MYVGFLLDVGTTQVKRHSHKVSTSADKRELDAYFNRQSGQERSSEVVFLRTMKVGLVATLCGAFVALGLFEVTSAVVREQFPSRNRRDKNLGHDKETIRLGSSLKESGIDSEAVLKYEDAYWASRQMAESMSTTLPPPTPPTPPPFTPFPTRPPTTSPPTSSPTRLPTPPPPTPSPTRLPTPPPTPPPPTPPPTSLPTRFPTPPPPTPPPPTSLPEECLVNVSDS
jgi:hypothetical protein